jgi:pyruvate/oxaloacetate carboxyltransferase
MDKKRYEGAISLIKSQTNYTEEEAIKKLEKWGGSYMDVIKEYLNPNFNVKVIKKDTRSTNEKMMFEIRDFMDTVSQGFERRKIEEEKKQEYLKNVYANFLEVKKDYPECKYNPPDILTCDPSCLNPLCPGELLPDKKYSKMKEPQNEVIEV